MVKVIFSPWVLVLDHRTRSEVVCRRLGWKMPAALQSYHLQGHPNPGTSPEKSTTIPFWVQPHLPCHGLSGKTMRNKKHHKQRCPCGSAREQRKAHATREGREAASCFFRSFNRRLSHRFRSLSPGAIGPVWCGPMKGLHLRV